MANQPASLERPRPNFPHATELLHSKRKPFLSVLGQNLVPDISIVGTNPKLPIMDLHELQNQFTLWRDEATYAFQKVPGSAVIIRYVRSSYQNDPVRSALELVLVIFVMHYLFAPSYSTKKNEIKLTEAVSARPLRHVLSVAMLLTNRP